MRRDRPGNVLICFAMFFTLLYLLILVMAPNVSAADCGGVGTSIIGDEACAGTDANSTDLNSNPIIGILKYGIRIMVGLVGVVAVGSIVYASIIMASAASDAGQKAKAIEMIRNTIIGLLFFGIMALGLNYLIPGGVFGDGSTTGSGGSSSTGGSGNSNGSGGSSSNGGSNGTGLSTSSGNGKTGKLTLASWNTWYRNGASGVVSSVRTLMGSVQVVGLQEARAYGEALTNSVGCASCPYGVYPDSTTEKERRPNPIVWDKKRLTLQAKGTIVGTKQGTADNRYISWVKLKDVQTEGSFYFMNTHLPMGVSDRGCAKKSGGSYTSNVLGYREQMENLTAKIRELQRDNVPIFLTGDFNVSYRADDCTDFFPKKKLATVGVYSNWQLTNLAGIGSSWGTHYESSSGAGGGRRLIDYVFAWKRSDVVVNSTRILGCSGKTCSNGGWGGSDHRAVLANITITTAKGPAL